MQENTGLKNELNDLQRKIKNLETKLGGLEKLQEEQEIILKKLEQDHTRLKELQSKIGNLETKLDGLEKVQSQIGYLETKLEGLKELQGVQRNTSKNLEQEDTTLKELQL